MRFKSYRCIRYIIFDENVLSHLKDSTILPCYLVYRTAGHKPLYLEICGYESIDVTKFRLSNDERRRIINLIMLEKNKI